MELTAASANRPLLLYRDTCPKCRFLSKLLVRLSLNRIERVPIASARAAEVVRLYPGCHQKLTLMDKGRFAIGWRVVPKAASCLLRSWFHFHARH
jgi:hypothetical protein